MGSARVLSYKDAKKQPDGTVFTYSMSGVTEESIVRGGKMYFNWGHGLEMTVGKNETGSWHDYPFTLKFHTTY